MPKNLVEMVLALGVAALGIAGTVAGHSYAGQARYAPVAVMVLTTVCALAWAGQSAIALARGGREPLPVTPPEVMRFLMVVAVAILFVLAMTYIGFFTSIAVMVPGLAWLLGYRQPMGLLIGTTGFILVLYLVFRTLLSVPLPDELLLTAFGAGAH